MEKVSLLGKWLKSVNTSSEESRMLAKKFCKVNGISEKTYRKSLVMLRKYLNVVEVKMSSRQWDKIDFSTVPSKAMNMYTKAFNTHVPERVSEYFEKLKKGETKINASTLYPYEIIEKIFNERYNGLGYPRTSDSVELGLLEEAWKALPNYFDQPHNIVCCADVSGSMNGRPMATSIGLSLYCAERNQGAYNGLYLTFTDKPTFLKVDEDTSLSKKISAALDHVGYNTNLDGMYEAIYNLTVRTGEAPECLVVISDGEIDRFYRAGTCESLLMKWERKFFQAGFKIPKTVMWNVEARENHYLDKSSNPNISFVSGSSAGIFSNIVNLKDYDAYEAMVRVLEPYEWE